MLEFLRDATVFASILVCATVAVIAAESWCRRRDQRQADGWRKVEEIERRHEIHTTCCCDDGFNRDFDD